MKKYLLLLLLVSLAGCASQKQYFIEQPSKTKYDLTTSSIYIPLTKDGVEISALPTAGKKSISDADKIKKYWIPIEKIIAEDSGVEVRNIINKRLSNIHTNKSLITIGTKTESLEEALLSAKKTNSDYLLYTDIKVWQDPFFCGNFTHTDEEIEMKTKEPFIIDAVNIYINIYEVRTGEKLETIEINDHGCPYILAPLTSSPNDRLNKVFKAWLKDTQLQKTNS